MLRERRTCLSPLEQQRCRIIPAIPQIFNTHSALVESDHRKSIDRILDHSPPTTPIISSIDQENGDFTEIAVIPSRRTTEIQIHTNVEHLETLLPQNEYPPCCLEGPFRFVSIPNRVSATRINSQQERNSRGNGNSDVHESKQFLEPQFSVSDSQNDFSRLRHKDSCSCYGLSRGSGPLVQGQAASTILSKEFPHLSKFQHVVDILSQKNVTNEAPTNQEDGNPSPSTALFPPLRIGILVGGATSSGLHNVTVGLYHFLKKFCKPCSIVRLSG